MSPRLLASNNASSTLNGNITDAAVSLTLTNSASFPDTAPFRITIDSEIIEVGAINKGTHVCSSLLRAREGTSAAAHLSGAAVTGRWTAGMYGELAIDADLTTHTGNTTTAHGAVSTATASKLVVRDASARAAFAAPSAAGDVAILSTVTDHNAVTAAGIHGSDAAATANKLVHRDASGRAAFVAGSAAGDVVIKSQLDAKAPLLLTINNQDDSYTLVIGDGAGVLVDMNKATAQTLTVPANASVAFVIGTQILVRQKGAGQVTITPAGGVTFNGADAAYKTRVLHSVAGLIKVAENTWVISGDVIA